MPVHSLRLHPGVIFIASLIAAALLEDRYPAALGLPFPANVVIAGVFMALFAATLFWGIWALNHAKTPSEPNQEPTAIVTFGPFRYSRNPMYLSLVIMGIAWACLVSSGWFLVSTAAVFLLLNFVVIPREETALTRRFPQEFAEWSVRTRRWL